MKSVRITCTFNNMPATRLRRKYLLRLLAQIDQQIAEASYRAANPWLPADERNAVVAQLKDCRDALARVEGMLGLLGR